ALNPYQSRFELLTGQIGALFFLGASLVGIEVAPTSAYFAEVWMPLVCFCYGVSALYAERRDKREAGPPVPFPALSLAEVRTQLARSRRERQEQALAWLNDLPAEQYAIKEEERYGNLRLHTLQGKNFAGQLVEVIEPSLVSQRIEEGLPLMLRRLFGARAPEQSATEEKHLAYLSLFARAEYLARIGM
ncbi:MAG TPA: hypothetical protein VKU00_00790, partial [Chthonomonadaceae bacterium]|nr:hypothetical protein [Chthonomonadaceae bacterium]